MNIKLGKFDKEVPKPSDLATNLEFTITWSHISDDPARLLRVCAASVGIALEPFSMLQNYRLSIIY